jgi:hypothetical protein
MILASSILVMKKIVLLTPPILILAFISLSSHAECIPNGNASSYTQCLQRLGSANYGVLNQTLANQAIRNQMQPQFTSNNSTQKNNNAPINQRVTKRD